MGGVDGQGTSIPDVFTENSRLRVFTLLSAGIGGTIPPSIAKCKELEILDLGDNFISGASCRACALSRTVIWDMAIILKCYWLAQDPRFSSQLHPQQYSAEPLANLSLAAHGRICRHHTCRHWQQPLPALPVPHEQQPDGYAACHQLRTVRPPAMLQLQTLVLLLLCPSYASSIVRLHVHLASFCSS